MHAAGYGGAFCKIELGTGGDYVDEEDEPPPWANMGDVKRLKQFWKEQYALAAGHALAGSHFVWVGDEPGVWDCHIPFAPWPLCPLSHSIYQFLITLPVAVN